MLEEVLKAMWFIMPAYIANASPPVISKFEKLSKHNHPIDFGKKINGREIFGGGKTWNGLIFGVLLGTIFGVFQSIAPTDNLPISLPVMTIALAVMLSFGALIGDIIGSFIKRRLNFPRGKRFPILDQLDFILGAFLFASFVREVNSTHLIILLIITPIIHIISNMIGYKLGVKKEPW